MTDVIVLGGGLAGCTAALSAIEAGAQVLLLEKLQSGSGSTWQSAGSFSFAGTDLQRDAGLEDGPDKLYADLIRAGAERNDARLVERFCDRQPDIYAWLKQHGVVFERVQLSGGQGVPRSHACNPAQAMAARAELGLARQQAEGELVGLHRQLTQLIATAERYRSDAVAPSAELVRIAEAAYRAGESTVLELLDAYKGALEAELTALDLEWKAREARIELDQLTGNHSQ